MIKKTLLSIFLFLLISVFSWGTDYYVDATDGDDAKDGLSAANAWETITKVNSVAFSAGDNILFQRGETWTDTTTLVLDNAGGSGNVITYGAYGTGNLPKFTGMTTRGISLLANYITLENVEVYSVGGAGLYSSGAYTGITVQNTVIHDNPGYGMWLAGGTNLLVSSNTAYQNGTEGQAYDNIHIENSTDYVAEYNVSYDCQDGSELDASDDGAACTGIWRYNIIYRTGWDADNVAASIKMSGDVVGTYHKVYYNLIYDVYVGITNGGTHSQIDIWNNTIYTTAYAGIQVTQTDGLDIQNNIVHTTVRALLLSGTAPDVCNYNNWYNWSSYLVNDHDANTWTTLVQWQAVDAGAYAQNSIDDDPLFVNAAADFRLQQTSPCINAGVNVGLTKDIRGTGVPQGAGYDIGVYEYRSLDKATKTTVTNMLLGIIPGFETFVGLCILSILGNFILLFLLYKAHNRIARVKEDMRFFGDMDNISAWCELERYLGGK